MSTYTNYLSQVHNKMFNKMSHWNAKIFKTSHTTAIKQLSNVIYKSLNLVAC